MEQTEMQRAVEAILFAAGEPVAVSRLALALDCDEEAAAAAAEALRDALAFDRRGVRVIRLEDSFQMVSDREQADRITAALEIRKPPRLSAAALETLTIIAYYQPATKTLAEQIRGVDCAWSVSVLLQKGLIEECGRLNVPGRPILYRTTPEFLRIFGLESLEDLPEIDLVEVENPVPAGTADPEAPADAPEKAS